MKKTLLKIAGVAILCTTGIATAQQNPNATNEGIEVTKYTLMERFEPRLMLSAEERVQLKEEHLADREQKLHVLDTLDISERKRERLMNDLIAHPYSQRLSRTLAEIEFSEN